MIESSIINTSKKNKGEIYLDRSSRRSTTAMLMVFVIGMLDYNKRDLKPENFLFMSKKDEKCLKLIDFGLSKNFFEIAQPKQNTPPSSPTEPPGRGRRQVRSAMKTKAGTVKFPLLSLSILHLKY